MSTNTAHSPITGHGPGFARALRKFNERQHNAARVGTWRKGPSAYKKNDGPFIDKDWMIEDESRMEPVHIESPAGCRVVGSYGNE